jgi:hypothetical protein
MGEVLIHMTTRSGPVGSNPTGSTAVDYVSTAKQQPTSQILERFGVQLRAAAELADDGMVTEIRLVVGPADVVDPRRN